MTIGERIKEIRTKLGMSQVSFADKLNVSKQTLYKYENNIITNIPSDKIEIAAKLGNVSPSYIMGWDRQVKLFTGIDGVLEKMKEDERKNITDKELELIYTYRKLSIQNQFKLSKYANAILSTQEMENDLMIQAAHERTDIKVTDEMRKHDDDLMDGDW